MRIRLPQPTFPRPQTSTPHGAITTAELTTTWTASKVRQPTGASTPLRSRTFLTPSRITPALLLEAGGASSCQAAGYRGSHELRPPMNFLAQQGKAQRTRQSPACAELRRGSKPPPSTPPPSEPISSPCYPP